VPETAFSLRLYRWLLKLYPAGFREDYAELLERAFRDELHESTGAAALAILWIRLFADLAISIPSQFVREVTQDARHALRLWARHPWHTGFAILALAIGIGANTGVFSVVNALLLRSLPFRDPERLAYLSSFFEPHDSAKQFHEWRGQSAYLADAAVFEHAFCVVANSQTRKHMSTPELLSSVSGLRVNSGRPRMPWATKLR